MALCQAPRRCKAANQAELTQDRSKVDLAEDKKNNSGCTDYGHEADHGSDGAATALTVLLEIRQEILKLLLLILLNLFHHCFLLI